MVLEGEYIIPSNEFPVPGYHLKIESYTTDGGEKCRLFSCYSDQRSSPNPPESPLFAISVFEDRGLTLIIRAPNNQAADSRARFWEKAQAVLPPLSLHRYDPAAPHDGSQLIPDENGNIMVSADKNFALSACFLPVLEDESLRNVVWIAQLDVNAKGAHDFLPRAETVFDLLGRYYQVELGAALKPAMMQVLREKMGTSPSSGPKPLPRVEPPAP